MSPRIDPDLFYRMWFDDKGLHIEKVWNARKPGTEDEEEIRKSNMTVSGSGLTRLEEFFVKRRQKREELEGIEP